VRKSSTASGIRTVEVKKMSDIKPMLAASECVGPMTCKLPAWFSLKYDGIRCLIVEGEPRTRALKPVPNRHIDRMLRQYAVKYPLDGELFVLGENGRPDFRRTTSAVMSEDGEPDFRFGVFDWVPILSNVTYRERYDTLRRACDRLPGFVQLVDQIELHQPHAVEKMYLDALQDGYEGLIGRDPESLYKFGRATLREGSLFKIKPREDDEAVVVEVIQQMHNTNQAKKNELGRTKRSSAKAGKVPMEMAGALRVEWRGMQFEIGTGFTDAEKKSYWARRNELVGKKVVFSYQIGSGYDAPRSASFKGFRDERDL
jgi:DNA ligase-1